MSGPRKSGATSAAHVEGDAVESAAAANGGTEAPPVGPIMGTIAEAVEDEDEGEEDSPKKPKQKRRPRPRRQSVESVVPDDAHLDPPATEAKVIESMAPDAEHACWPGEHAAKGNRKKLLVKQSVGGVGRGEDHGPKGAPL